MTLDTNYSIMAGEDVTIVTDITCPLPLFTTYLLSIRGSLAVDIAANTSGAFLSFPITKLVTASLRPGYFDLLLVKSVGGTIRTVLARSTLTVAYNLLDETGYVDTRSFDEKIVAALEAYILGKADNEQLDHLKAIESHRELYRMSSLELQKLLDLHKRRVYRAKNPGKGSHIARNVLQCFTR